MAGRCACNQVCNCCTQSTPSIDVAGVGTVGQCFRPQVAYSDDLKNRALPGTDGGVYVGPACLLDRLGNPITSNSAGCVQLPAPTILNYSGVAITPDSQGRIPLPTGGLPPAFGDGLTTLPDGTLIADVPDVWPTTDAQGTVLTGASTDGAAIYVDGNGQLRAPAEHTSCAAGTANDVFPTAILAVPTTFVTDPSVSCVLNNPSPARQMTVFRNQSVIVDLITPQGASADIALEYNFDAAGWATGRTVSWPEVQSPGTVGIRYKGQITFASSGTMAPDDSHVVQTRLRVTKSSGNPNDPVLVSVRAACQLWGVTR